MSSPALTTLQQELQHALEQLLPRLAGLQHFAALDLPRAVQDVLQQEIDRYARRRDFLQAALAALGLLEGDGYPTLAPVTISPIIFAVLDRTLGELMAAFEDFQTPEEAKTAVIVPGDPVLQEG